jgi:hypothetical protein
LILCYVDHHDPAHDWARRRKIETNPVTGGAQIVVILETVREIQTPFQSRWRGSRSTCQSVVLITEGTRTPQIRRPSVAA